MDSKGLKASLAKKHFCYVLITCDAPADDGKMAVEMTYEGDPTLAAYLLQGAQTFMDDQDENEPQPLESKIHSLE